MLGSTLDKQVQAYLIATHETGGVVNSEVASYSSCDGYCSKTGQQSISPKWWSRCVKRKANTKAKIAVTDFNELKSQFLIDIRKFMNNSL